MLDEPGRPRNVEDVTAAAARRRSPSISSTRRPAIAIETARLLETTVLPSPGLALVTASVRAPTGAGDRKILRPDAADGFLERGGQGVSDRRSDRFRLETWEPMPSSGRPSASAMSCGLARRGFRYSSTNTQADRQEGAAKKRDGQVERLPGPDRARWGPRRRRES